MYGYAHLCVQLVIYQDSVTYIYHSDSKIYLFRWILQR